MCRTQSFHSSGCPALPWHSSCPTETYFGTRRIWAARALSPIPQQEWILFPASVSAGHYFMVINMNVKKEIMKNVQEPSGKLLDASILLLQPYSTSSTCLLPIPSTQILPESGKSLVG